MNRVLAALLLLPGCPAQWVPTHLGFDAAGRRLELAVAEDGTFALSDGEDRWDGAFAEEEGGPIDGFLQVTGDVTGRALRLDTRLVLLDLDERDFVWATSVDVDVARWAPLVQGSYTFFRWRSEATGLADLGFFSIDGDAFRLKYLDSATERLDDVEFRAANIDDAEAELAGTFTLGGDLGTEVSIDADDGVWQGATWPGWAMVLVPPDGDGLLFAYFCPNAHVQLSTFDGPHQYFELRAENGVFGGPYPAEIDQFGPEAERTRSDGSTAEAPVELSTRTPIFNLGNAVSWEVPGEEALALVQWDSFSAYATLSTCPRPPPGQPPDCAEDENRISALGIGVHPR